MNAQLTPKDWELISTYLDGQLSDKEKRRVQDLLVLRPELNDGLDELRRTRAVLRAAPRLRAPRNFTITPEMARSARPRFHCGWAPSFGLASAVATFLLVLSFFFRMAPVMSPMAAQAPGAIRSSAASTENPPIIIWGGNPNGTAPQVGYGGGGPAGTGETAPLLQATNPAGAQDNQNVPPPSIAAQPDETPTTQAQLTAPQFTEKVVPPTESLDSSGPILGIAPADEQGKVIVPTAAASQTSPSTALGVFDWRWVQAGLGIVAILTALAGFVLWWRSRH